MIDSSLSLALSASRMSASSVIEKDPPYTSTRLFNMCPRSLACGCELSVNESRIAVNRRRKRKWL